MTQTIHYVISEQDFDLSLIPKAGRQVGTDAFRKHVTKYFRKQYESLDGETTVVFEDGNIAVTWIPKHADLDPMDAIIGYLNAGKYDQAAPMLETLIQANPKDYNALYNLGMVYSDQGRLDDARKLLRRSVDSNRDYANAWVALGVAALRANDLDEARPALERALELEPKNPFALRTLGSLHAMANDFPQAVARLRAAIKLTPDDPIALLTLGQAIMQQFPEENAHEAGMLFHKVLELAPRGELAEKAKNALRAIANQTFRSRAVGELRPDAVMYCLDALERFEGMEQTQLAPLIMEMATLGEQGLPVNDPEKKFTLRLLPGEYTGLQIVCMMHVGMKKIDEVMDSGFDIDREYEAASATYKKQQQSD